MPVRLVVGVYVAAFAIATAFHVFDLMRWGFLPYRFAPWPANAFWTSLTILDPLVILLLAIGRRRPAILLALAIMLGDVAANAYALFALGYAEFARSLPVQAAFLGFVLGSSPFLWRAEGGPAISAPPASSDP